ncbi:hypothetical protein PAXINDRAFT_11008 [Paxillus involutus ATCC 200175]|nr:hypothetical protein PAXINDRAFT_11008 [Paxillus involutus ATCC 200175]
MESTTNEGEGKSRKDSVEMTRPAMTREVERSTERSKGAERTQRKVKRSKRRQMRGRKAERASKHDRRRTSTDTVKPPPVPTPSPPPAPTPPHPERLDHDNVDTAKSNKTAARLCANTLHDPGGETTTPDNNPPSVRLKGESGKLTSLNVEPTDVEPDVDDIEDNHNDHRTPRGPVGTPDGDERRPNEPTEPPDEAEGVEKVKSKLSRQGDELRGREDKRVKSREVEGELGEQSEDNGCQRDGRTCNATSSTS